MNLGYRLKETCSHPPAWPPYKSDGNLQPRWEQSPPIAPTSGVVLLCRGACAQDAADTRVCSRAHRELPATTQSPDWGWAGG